MSTAAEERLPHAPPDFHSESDSSCQYVFWNFQSALYRLLRSSKVEKYILNNAGMSALLTESLINLSLATPIYPLETFDSLKFIKEYVSLMSSLTENFYSFPSKLTDEGICSNT